MRIGDWSSDVCSADLAAFDEAEEALGPIGLLANNAGANFPVLAENISANAWGAVTRIAIDGTFLCSAEFARRRIARGEGGAIVVNSAHYIWTEWKSVVSGKSESVRVEPGGCMLIQRKKILTHNNNNEI